MDRGEVLLRRAGDADALAAANVWLRSFTAALPTVRRAHTDDEIRDWFSTVLVPHYETWVAVSSSTSTRPGAGEDSATGAWP